MQIQNLLNNLGEFLTSITGLGAAESVILIGVTLSLLPPLYRGVLDNRVESIIEGLTYTRTVLLVSTILSYYYIFQEGVATELILSVGGIVLGLTFNQWIQKLTDL